MVLEEKTDQAALKLKAAMGLEPSPVPGGQAYANQTPPSGSYAAQALDQQQQAAQEREAAQDLARIPTNPTNPGEQPIQLPQHAVESPQPAESQPGALPASQEDLSPRASERIAELARMKNEFEQRASLAEAERTKLNEQNQSLLTQFQQLKDEYQQVMQANLDHLDPDERARVLAEANARQVADSVEQRLLSKVQPIMDAIQQNNFNMELGRLAQMYPEDFDYERHAPGIRALVGANNTLSVEQAFRALGFGGDPNTAVGSSGTAPPVVVPRGTRGTTHIAEPPPPNPNLDLIEQRNEWRTLAQSRDPSDQRRANDMLQEHLKNRLGI